MPIWGVIWTTYDVGEGKVSMPGIGIIGWSEIWYSVPDKPRNPFQDKVYRAKDTAITKIEEADEDCLKLMEHMGVPVGRLLTLLKTDGQSFKIGILSEEDSLWDVMGGEVKYTTSTTTVADIFRDGAPGPLSGIRVDGLSAPNGTIYLDSTKISWENIVHEEIHQLGPAFQSDFDILTKLANAYPKGKINPKGRSSQLSDIIEKKCK
jgi:hypothetical protein